MKPDQRVPSLLFAILAMASVTIGGVAFEQGGPGIITTVVGANPCRSLTISGRQVVSCPQGFSGDDGPATSAKLSLPWGVAVDKSGNLFIADHDNNRIRHVDAATGTITTVAGSGVCQNSKCTGGFSGDGGPAIKAELDRPVCVAVDADGNLFICDPVNERVRRVDHATGIISTVAGNGTKGFSGDGGPAANAELHGPLGVAVDTTGNLFIADSWNNRIRRVDKTSGIITTVAGGGTCCYGVGLAGKNESGLATQARVDRPSAVLVDGSGNLFIAQPITSIVRRVDHATGMITTVAGGTCYEGQCGAGFRGDGGLARDSQLSSPSGLALDASGNLFIADSGNHRIRRVDHATGAIATVAGTAGNPYRGDGGPATSADLSMPLSVAVDADGNLFIADTNNHRVRKVSGTD